MTDHDLLLQFSQNRSQDAFAQLVRRHIDWLYSAALRMVRDQTLAQDVTQAVLLVLAQKAPKLAPTTPLAPWLFRVLQYVASNARLAEARRRNRESEAAAMRASSSTPDNAPDWGDVAPLLEPSVEELAAADRAAILLRFYGQLSFPEVGTALGLSEEAARKRVTRAVERLRVLMTRKRNGKALLPATALAVLLFQHTSHAVPAALTSAALGLSTGVASTPIITLAKGALTMLLRAQIRVFAAGVAGLLVTGVLGFAVAGAFASQPRTPVAATAAGTTPAPATSAPAATAPVNPLYAARKGQEDVLHPPKLSVDWKEMPLEEVSAALNAQLGGQYFRCETNGRGTGARVTLKVQDQPLWEILRQLHGQVPMAFSVPGDLGVNAATGVVNLIPAGRATPQPVYVTDGVCTVPRPTGDPATGDWELRCWIYTDPRVRLAYYMSALRVEKAIDQDGRELKVLPTSSRRELAGTGSRPMAVCTAAFAAAPGLKVIKELRGSAAVEVLERTQTVKIDLTKPQQEPVTTAVGKFTVEQGGNGEYTVKLEPAAGTAATRPADSPVAREGWTVLEMHLIDNLGNKGSVLIQPMASGRQNWTMQVTTRGRSAASLEIVLCPNAREMALPVVVKDLEVPANPVASLPRGR